MNNGKRFETQVKLVVTGLIQNSEIIIKNKTLIITIHFLVWY